jgi:hypothetical protein
MIDSLVVFLTPLWCIYILSRRVRSYLNIKKKQTLFSCVNNLVSQIYCVYIYWWCQHIQTHTYRQTNKQIIYWRFVLWFFLYVTIKLDRHSPDAVPERVHYAEHIPIYTNEMATCRNLRFRIESRTRRWWWWCRARGVLCTYIKVW